MKGYYVISVLIEALFLIFGVICLPWWLLSAVHSPSSLAIVLPLVNTLPASSFKYLHCRSAEMLITSSQRGITAYVLCLCSLHCVDLCRRVVISNLTKLEIHVGVVLDESHLFLVTHVRAWVNCPGCYGTSHLFHAHHSVYTIYTR